MASGASGEGQRPDGAGPDTAPTGGYSASGGDFRLEGLHRLIIAGFDREADGRSRGNRRVDRSINSGSPSWDLVGVPGLAEGGFFRPPAVRPSVTVRAESGRPSGQLPLFGGSIFVGAGGFRSAELVSRRGGSRPFPPVARERRRKRRRRPSIGRWRRRSMRRTAAHSGFQMGRAADASGWRALCCLWTCWAVRTGASSDAKRLYDDLINGYNSLIRPVGNTSDRLTVKLGLKLSQLIDVNLKHQIMTTNVWVEQEWNDYKLRWDPEEYGGVSKLHVPAEQIWLPDIVLYNNADGNYEVTMMTKAMLHADGQVKWKPPAIYKSSCEIDVEYFPFDQQNCFMKFGSWTYDGYTVDLKHKHQTEGSSEIEMGIDLSEFYLSVEWDIMAVPARRKEKFYSCCEEPYPDITFNVTLRRKTLFYTVNLIIPCVAISVLSILVFYLPSDSGEKVSLSISIMLSLGVFFLLLSEIIPPTSVAVPLLGIYLLFTMILVSLSVFVTIAVLCVNFRSPSTHKMAPWVRTVFLRILPRFLRMTRSEGKQPEDFESINNSVVPCAYHRTYQTAGLMDDLAKTDSDLVSSPNTELTRAYLNVNFIAQHMENFDVYSELEEDWQYVAMVLDRLFLWLFTIACVVGSAAILLQIPTLYDSRQPIDVVFSKMKFRLQHLQG